MANRRKSTCSIIRKVLLAVTRVGGGVDGDIIHFWLFFFYCLYSVRSYCSMASHAMSSSLQKTRAARWNGLPNHQWCEREVTIKVLRDRQTPSPVKLIHFIKRKRNHHYHVCSVSLKTATTTTSRKSNSNVNSSNNVPCKHWLIVSSPSTVVTVLVVFHRHLPSK